MGTEFYMTAGVLPVELFAYQVVILCCKLT